MKKYLFPYAIAPALVLGLLTVLRAWLEIQSPEGTLTRLISVVVLSLVWTLVMPAVMLKKGLSLMQGMLAAFVFYLLHRAFVGAAYALAWANKWTVEGTDEPVRYVKQVQDSIPDGGAAPSTAIVFLSNLLTVPFGLALLLVVWTITWAIAFRKTRPYAAGVPRVEASAD